ncbi:MAG: uroporphyrinogen-III C-methyltransferase [Gammaproteobacteria bacterium]|nr:uroporphyrinogen-III C-methyltransferase [Gammaproteobacteria bacterium]
MSESETPEPSSDKMTEASGAKAPQAEAQPKPAETQKRPAPDRERKPRGTGIVGIIAIIIALIALVGAGMLGWSWYQLRDRQARIPQLAGRVSDLSGQVAALGSAKANVQNVNALAGELHDLDRSLQARLDSVTESLGKLTSRLSGATNAYRVNQAVTLMRLAQVRLNLANDPAGAAEALRLADQTLVAANNPALAAVHTALQREIASLEAVPKVDVGGLYVRIEQLGRQIGKLPLAGAAISRPPAPATQSSGFNWSNIGAAFKRAFSSLVVIRHGPVAQPLLPPDQAWFVHQNVKLALASAQLALLQRNAQAWHASLERAIRWLENWFLTSDPAVQRTLKALRELAAVDIAPELPTLGSALTRLTSIRSQTLSPTPAPGPATQ